MDNSAGPASQTVDSQRLRSHVPVVTYSPESALKSPTRMARGMWRDLKASRELAWRLTVRDISAKYRQSVLGVLWAFLPPLATALIFVLLNQQKIINIRETDIPYPVFVMFGTVLWRQFIASLNAPIKAVNANKGMMTKINFPREALILSAVGQVLFELVINLAILAGVFAIFRVPVTWGLLLFPFAVLMLLLLGIALGLLLTPLGALYTDVSSAIATVTMPWFFITPVVYPPPQQFPLSLLCTLNPVSPILVGARDLATKGTMDDPVMFGVVSALVLFLLVLGWVLYRVSMPILIERMSA